MFDKMKQMMEIKRQAEQIKRELEAASVEISEVPGIKITVTGAQNFRSIEIEESLLGADNKGRLETDLLRSLNAAIKKSQVLAAQKMKDVMPGFPGL